MRILTDPLSSSLRPNICNRNGLIFRSSTEKILFNTDKMSPIRLEAYSEPYQTSKIELFAPLSTSFLSDFNLPSFVKPLSISFEVICQFSKKDIRAYSNITIASVISFPYYESAEAFLSKDPAVSLKWRCLGH